MARKKRRRDRGRPRDGTGAQIEIGLRGLLVGSAAVAVAAIIGWGLLRGTFLATRDSLGSVPTSVAPSADRPEWPAAGDGSWLTASGVPAIGSPSAPVTIVEYGDYQCGNCREFATQVMPWLRNTWIARGFVQVQYEDFAILGPESNRAAEAAHCAGEQGRFWDFHEALFEAQVAENDVAFGGDNLRALAEQLGLAAVPFTDCIAAGRYRDNVIASTRSAYDRGFDGTPTFVINGRSVAGSIPVDEWEQLFQAYERDFAAATARAP